MFAVKISLALINLYIMRTRGLGAFCRPEIIGFEHKISSCYKDFTQSFQASVNASIAIRQTPCDTVGSSNNDHVVSRALVLKPSSCMVFGVRSHQQA